MADPTSSGMRCTMLSPRSAVSKKSRVWMPAVWALLGCTDPGVVGRVCGAAVCDDASSVTDAASPTDAASEGADGGPSAACNQRYAECVLENLPALAYEMCLADALRCGAITEEQATTAICNARLVGCLMDRPITDCQLERDHCELDLWTDGGP